MLSRYFEVISGIGEYGDELFNLVILTIFYPLHRILNMDFAKSSVVLALRKD
jgi:hypothetical protein